MQISETQSEKNEEKVDSLGRSYSTGKRKASIARVWIKRGTGLVKINGKDEAKYFSSKSHRILLNQPLVFADRKSEIDITCTVIGGGLSGQAGAIILGISRALISHDELLKKDLKKDKLTTRDSRVVERKKYGHRKARRSFQFSKR